MTKLLLVIAFFYYIIKRICYKKKHKEIRIRIQDSIKPKSQLKIHNYNSKIPPFPSLPPKKLIIEEQKVFKKDQKLKDISLVLAALFLILANFPSIINPLGLTFKFISIFSSLITICNLLYTPYEIPDNLLAKKMW